MEKTPGLKIPSEQNEITAAFIQTSYEAATLHLKENICSFVWTNKCNHEAWTVGTWSMKTAPNKIRKFGSERDNANLPTQTHRNRPHAQKRTLVWKVTARRIRRERGKIPHAAAPHIADILPHGI